MTRTPTSIVALRRTGAPLAVLAAGMLALTTGCGPLRTQGPPSPADERSGPVEESPENEGLDLREACRAPERSEGDDEEDAVEQSRRVLYETFCSATLWFDGLFGGEPDVASARKTSGRVEASSLYRSFDGLDVDGRLRLRYELPNLERRMNLFLGRGDPDELVEDREEGFALRSAVPGIEAASGWLAGLGLDLSRWWGAGPELRMGVEASTSPEFFGQARFRQEAPRGMYAIWYFRETFFWKSQEGFGVTASVDYDRALSPGWLARWGVIGTLSEASEGVVWRSASVLYRNLGFGRAVAGEVFARGATSADVPMLDYGARAVHRRPLGRPYLFGELVVGYSWPKTDPLTTRSGTPMFGVGLELLFGTYPPY